MLARIAIIYDKQNEIELFILVDGQIFWPLQTNMGCGCFGQPCLLRMSLKLTFQVNWDRTLRIFSKLTDASSAHRKFVDYLLNKEPLSNVI